jgi:hypothetical protein
MPNKQQEQDGRARERPEIGHKDYNQINQANEMGRRRRPACPIGRSHATDDKRLHAAELATTFDIFDRRRGR